MNVFSRLRARVLAFRDRHGFLYGVVVTALVIAIMVPSSFVATRVAAYHLGRVVPGTPLYGLRRAIESERLSGLTDPEQQSAYHAFLARRRFEEALRVARIKPVAWIPTASAHPTPFRGPELEADERIRIVAGLIADGEGELREAVALGAGDDAKAEFERCRGILEQIPREESHELVTHAVEDALSALVF